MEKKLTIVIDGVPVPKGRPRFTKAGVAYTPAKTRAYEKQAALSGTLLPAKKPDVDNIAKAALDGLNGIVWRDDSLIVGLSIKKRYGERPRLEIDVYTEAAA